MFYVVTVASRGSDVPKDATWIFVPQENANGRSPDFRQLFVTLLLDLTNSSGPTLELVVSLDVSNAARTYSIGIMQPLAVVASDRNTIVTSTGSYLSRQVYHVNGAGQAYLILFVTLQDALTIRNFVSQGTGFTFGSNQPLPVEAGQFMKENETDPSWILNNSIILSTIYPPSWQLSLSETTPQPDKLYAKGTEKAAVWALDLKKAPSLYFETVEIVWNKRFNLSIRDLINFIAAICIAFGSGMMIEGFKPRRSHSLHNQLAAAGIAFGTGCFIAYIVFSSLFHRKKEVSR